MTRTHIVVYFLSFWSQVLAYKTYPFLVKSEGGIADLSMKTRAQFPLVPLSKDVWKELLSI